MDLQDLRAFIHVAELQNFSRAAARMRIAQSAISRRVQRLEHELGVTLLDRYGRGVRLTEFGILLQQKGSEVLQSIQQIKIDMMAMAKEPTGHIRLALTPATGQAVAPILIETFSKKYPRVTLQVMEGFNSTIQDGLTRNNVDLAILYNPDRNPDVSVTDLLTEPVYLIDSPTAPHAKEFLKNGNELALRDLFRLPLIMPSRTHSIRLLLDRSAAALGVKPNIVFEVDGMGIIKRLVERGMGCTIFSYAGVHEEVARGTLKIFPITDPELKWKLALVGRREQQSLRAMTDLKGLIEAEVRKLFAEKFHREQLTVATKLPDTPKMQLRRVK